MTLFLWLLLTTTGVTISYTMMCKHTQPIRELYIYIQSTHSGEQRAVCTHIYACWETDAFLRNCLYNMPWPLNKHTPLTQWERGFLWGYELLARHHSSQSTINEPGDFMTFLDESSSRGAGWFSLGESGAQCARASDASAGAALRWRPNETDGRRVCSFSPENHPDPDAAPRPESRRTGVRRICTSLTTGSGQSAQKERWRKRREGRTEKEGWE